MQRNLWPLVAAYLPGALIADRTALENRPASDGSVFLIANHKRNIEIPGAILRLRPGPPPLDSDRPFIGGLRLASPAWAFLENMRPSRAREGVVRTLTKPEIEERLDEMLRQSGEAAVQKLRDNAREIAAPLGLAAEFQQLDAMISTLLGTRHAALESPVAVARAAGFPYDPHRLDLFQRLFAELARSAPVTRPARPQDAHDFLGTWRVLSDQAEMSRLPRDFTDLTALLKSRHAQIMQGRPGKGPGRFKTELNRAGSTIFVAPAPPFSSRRLHHFRRAGPGAGNAAQRFRNLPRADQPSASRHLHDVSDCRGASVC